jgi:hypothetical protein
LGEFAEQKARFLRQNMLALAWEKSEWVPS